MKTFVDAHERTWSVVINTDAVRRIKDVAGEYLVDLVREGSDIWQRLHMDPCFVVDCAYGAVMPEAAARKVSREDFNAAMKGDCIAAARQAILEDLADFFPNPFRDRIKAALADRTERTAAEAAEKKEPENPAPAAPAATSAPGGSSGNSPASAAATPAP